MVRWPWPASATPLGKMAPRRAYGLLFSLPYDSARRCATAWETDWMHPGSAAGPAKRAHVHSVHSVHRDAWCIPGDRRLNGAGGDARTTSERRPPQNRGGGKRRHHWPSMSRPIAAAGFHRSDCYQAFLRPFVFSAKGAAYDSPGQAPAGRVALGKGPIRKEPCRGDLKNTVRGA